LLLAGTGHRNLVILSAKNMSLEGLLEQLTQAVLVMPIYSQVLEELAKQAPHASMQKLSSAQIANTVNPVTLVLAVKQSPRVKMLM
jgi:hypothetical protein